MDQTPSTPAQAPAQPEPSLLWLALEAHAWQLADGLLKSGLKFDFSERHESAYSPKTLLELLFRNADFDSHRKSKVAPIDLALTLARLGAPFLPAPIDAKEKADDFLSRLRSRDTESSILRAFEKGRWTFVDGVIAEALATPAQILAALTQERPDIAVRCLRDDNLEALNRLLAWGLDPNAPLAHGSHPAVLACSPEALAALQAAGADLPAASDSSGRSLAEIVSAVPEARKRAAMLSIVLKAVKEAQGAAAKKLGAQRVYLPGEERPDASAQPAALERAHEALATVAKTGNRSGLKRACALFGADPVAYRTPQGENLLSIALWAGNFENARSLIGLGAKILENGLDGQPALMRALWAPFSSMSMSSSRTSKAAKALPARRLAFLEELPALCASEGFSWSAADEHGRNWLMRALGPDSRPARERLGRALGENPLDGDVLSFLLKRGYDVNATDARGHSLLDAVFQARVDPNYAQRFIREGALFNRFDGDGAPVVARLVAHGDFYRAPALRDVLDGRSLRGRSETDAQRAIASLSRELCAVGPAPEFPRVEWREKTFDGRSMGQFAIDEMAPRFASERDSRSWRQNWRNGSLSSGASRPDPLSISMADSPLAHQVTALLSLGLPALARGDDGVCLWDAWALWMFPEPPAGRTMPDSVLQQHTPGRGVDAILSVARQHGPEHFICALGSLLVAGFRLPAFALPQASAPTHRYGYGDEVSLSRILPQLFEGSGAQSIDEALMLLPADHLFFNARHPRALAARDYFVEANPGLFNRVENAALARFVPDPAKVAPPRKTPRL